MPSSMHHNLEASITIREETQKDHKAVFQLVKEAFTNEAQSDHKEQYLVERLRNGNGFVAELSLVAIYNCEIVGYVLLTKAAIKNEKKLHTTLVLAPIAVGLDFQKKGVGARLMSFAHKRASKMGYGSIVIIGHEHYYPKFGYQKASKFGIRFPFEVPDKNGFVIELKKGDLTGKGGELVYPKEFFET